MELTADAFFYIPDQLQNYVLPATDTPELPTSSMELLVTWLASAGVRVAGASSSHACDLPAPLMSDEFVPRADFSEAWLWRLVAVGASGSAATTARAPHSVTRYEAAALCLARTGVAAAPPALLQVFREFFIHADGPRRLRRGDSTIIRYRIFNYLYQPLSIQIQVLTEPHIEVTEATESACLAARSSLARRAEVRARFPGEATLRIRAASVADGHCGNSTGGVSDEVIIKINVDQEGAPVQEYKSIMLCGKDTDTLSPWTVQWRWPRSPMVAGSEALTVWAAGDLAGPLLADADALVQLPRGCGEQNLARLAASLLALGQLHPRSAAHAAARAHVAAGFTRQLQYAHPSGGFSAFGPSDPGPSTWLTAFCIRYLGKAYQVVSPGAPLPQVVQRAERWLRSRQMENGCFRNEGQVFHRELKGGLNEEGEIASVTLTAYIITSLIEGSINIPSYIIRNSLSCLRALPLTKSTRVYSHAVIAYALMRVKRYEEELRRSNEASWQKRVVTEDVEMRELLELMKLAKRKGNYVWWEGGTLSTSIEATGYALLALAECPAQLRSSCTGDARSAVLWLSTHRNPGGGFVATQDTLVALEGLSRWSSLQTPASNLTVTARTSTVRSTVLLPGAKVPDVLKMEPGPQLQVTVEGSGCALIQATRSYNTLSPDEHKDHLLTVQVAVHTDGPFNCDANNTMCFCAAVVETCVMWVGQFPEMALLEITLPGGFGADAARLYSQLDNSDSLLRRIELTASGGRASLYLSAGAALARSGHRCYRAHAVGPRANTRPAYATVLDYYRPDVKDTQMYTIPEDCPPRISEYETNDYLPSDNLFIKAKSLTDDGEILINYDFSFEDIPEGVPLDDPMYDNLTLKSKDEHYSNEDDNFNGQQENSVNKSDMRVKEAMEDGLNAGFDDEVVLKASNLRDEYKNASVKRNEIDSEINSEVNISRDSNKKNGNKTGEIQDTINNQDIKHSNVPLASNSFKETKYFIEQSIDTTVMTNQNEITRHLNLNVDSDKLENIHHNDRRNSATTKAIENIARNDTIIDNEDTNITQTQVNETNGKLETEILKESDKGTVLEQTNGKLKVENPNTHETLKVENPKEKDEKLKVDNPILSDFHVIDSQTDLEVPTGVEGPVPTVVLPPQGFVLPPPDTGLHPVPRVPEVSRREFQNIRTMYDQPYSPSYYNRDPYRHRPYFNPVTG